MYLQYLSGTFYTKLGIASRPRYRCGDMSGFPRKAFAKFCGSYGALSGGGVAFAFQVGAMGWDRKGGYHGITRVSPQAHPRWRWDNDSQVLDVFTVYCTLNLRSSLIFVHFSHPFLGSLVGAPRDFTSPISIGCYWSHRTMAVGLDWKAWCDLLWETERRHLAKAQAEPREAEETRPAAVVPPR